MELLAQEGIQDRSVPVEFTGKVPCGSRLGLISAFDVLRLQSEAFTSPFLLSLCSDPISCLFQDKSLQEKVWEGM